MPISSLLRAGYMLSSRNGDEVKFSNAKIPTWWAGGLLFFNCRVRRRWCNAM